MQTAGPGIPQSELRRQECARPEGTGCGPGYKFPPCTVVAPWRKIGGLHNTRPEQKNLMEGREDHNLNDGMARGLVVIGMHRSGSSLAMQLLHACGAAVGNPAMLAGARADNPEGFFERKDLVHLHESSLAQASASWWNPWPLLKAERPAEHKERFIISAQRILSAVRPTVSLWALKDPRITLFLPEWLEVLPQDTLFILAWRRPGDVARSLTRRDGLSAEHGLALWELYNRYALAMAPADRVVCLNYNDLLLRPADTLQGLAKRLKALGLDIDRLHAAEIAETVIDPALQRSADSSEARLPDTVADLCRLLSEGSCGDPPPPSAHVVAPSPDVLRPPTGRIPRAAPRLLAFYLPQFHTIPENDAWWGAGFTEWTNVRKALPLFPGHRQPRVPTELGFYDLSEPAVLERQAALAREHGIHGFCFYHYWFSGGKRLLEKPVESLLRTGRPDFPFCLCWANESWTRRWDGADKDILMPQHYRAEDPEQFAVSLLPHFRDSRYIRTCGGPLLLIYRPQEIPQIERTVEHWRNVWRQGGFPDVFLAAVLTRAEDAGLPPGFDAGVEFPPHRMPVQPLDPVTLDLEGYLGSVYDYNQLVIASVQQDAPHIFPGVTLGWDNTPRKPRDGTVLHNAGPAQYAYWLARAQERAAAGWSDGGFVFINAWNEWAEGAYLEPDRDFGRAFLEATRWAADGFVSERHGDLLGVPALDALVHEWARNSLDLPRLKQMRREETAKRRKHAAQAQDLRDRVRLLENFEPLFTASALKPLLKLERSIRKRLNGPRR